MKGMHDSGHYPSFMYRKASSLKLWIHVFCDMLYLLDSGRPKHLNAPSKISSLNERGEHCPCIDF